VLLNAGAAIAAYDASGIVHVDSLIAKGIDEARDSIDTGAAATCSPLGSRQPTPARLVRAEAQALDHLWSSDQAWSPGQK